MECPRCKQPGFKSNAELFKHFQTKHFRPDKIKFAIAILFCIVSVGISIYFNNYWDAEPISELEKKVELDFTSETVISNTEFYYNDGEGWISFSYNVLEQNVSFFNVVLPEGLTITDIGITDNSHKQKEHYMFHEADVTGGYEGEKVYTFERTDQEFLPHEVRYITANFSGEIEPEGEFGFYMFSDREESKQYFIHMEFKDVACKSNCVVGKTGPYSELFQREMDWGLIVESDPSLQGNSVTEIRFILNTENTDMGVVDVVNYLLPLLTGFAITAVFYIK